MSFAKNVNRYYKYVLGSIVAIMAISLVASGNLNMMNEDEEKPFATIFEKVTVTEREWRDAHAKAGAWFRLKVVHEVDESNDYNFQRFKEILFRYRDGHGALVWHDQFQPDQEGLNACAKELIILGYDAKAKQVRVTDEEVERMIKGYLARAGIGTGEEDTEKQHEFARRYFRAEPEAFKAAVRDSILIDKALALDIGGCNIRYESLFSEKLASSRTAKVLVAGIDGSRLPGDLVAVTDEEIRTEFERRRENFKLPAKVQIEYLMASFDDFKARIKDPTPDEIKAYYEKNKREFLKKAPALEEGHSEHDGHNHEPPKEEFKPIEEVTEEIIKKIKEGLASENAYKTIYAISSKDYAGRWTKLLDEEKAREPKDPKAVRERALARTGPIFGELKNEYKAKEIELRNGITLPFDKVAREPFDNELGKPAKNDPIDWAMQAPVGEVSYQLYRSDKGFALVRLSHKIDGYESDLTGPVREKIRQDLQKDRVADRARRLADEIVTRLRANGPAELARLKARPDITIQRSTYLAQTTPDGETGLTPAGLAQQVKSAVLKPPAPIAEVSPGGIEAQAVHGDVVGGDRKNWSFVVVVEDVVQVAPEVKDDEFLQDVRLHEEQALSRVRAEQASLLVSRAEWTEVKSSAPAPSAD